MDPQPSFDFNGELIVDLFDGGGGAITRVRVMRSEGMAVAKIGAIIGLHGSTVHDIVTGKTWGHVI